MHAARAYAHAYRGSLLTLTERPEAAVDVLERARALADEAGRPEVGAICLNYLGLALADLGDPRAEPYLRQSLALALALGHHEYAAAGYTNLNETLYRLGRWDAMDRSLADGLTFTLERDFRSHAYNLEVHRCLLLAHRGQWDDAEAGLRALVESVDEPGHHVPVQRARAGPAARPSRRPAAGPTAVRGLGPGLRAPLAPGAGPRRDRVRRVVLVERRDGPRGAGPRRAAPAAAAAGARAGGAASCCATSPGRASTPRLRRLPAGVRRRAARRLGGPPQRPGPHRRPVRARAGAGRSPAT